jgi:L-proline amide hydrolase
MTHEGQLEWDGHRTWYRVVGELEPGATKAPVVIAHGGPGATHDYVEPISNLSRYGRACVLYDQLGNGKSEHLPDAPAEFWTVDLFKRELGELLRHLGIDERYHYVGQSWGGMLGMEHALDHPAGLVSLVVCDSPASIPLWVAEADRLRLDLPEDVQATLTLHEENGTTSDPAYEEAVMVFYKRHLCRADPWPDGMVRSLEAMGADPTVYGTMNGPSEFHCIGTLKDWDITDQIHRIDAPTLLVSGRYDEATPYIVEQIHERIPNSRWILFEESSHTPHLEEPDRFFPEVEAFLEEIEGR